MNTNPLLRVVSLALVAIAATTLIVGCETGGNSDAAEESASARKPELNIRAGVPTEAQEMTQGTGSLSYTADQSGTLYLYDLNDQSVIKTLHVSEGDRILVSGSSGRATLNGNEVTTTGVRANRTYIAYLVPTGDRGMSSRATPPAATETDTTNSRSGRLYVELAEEGDEIDE